MKKRSRRLYTGAPPGFSIRTKLRFGQIVVIRAWRGHGTSVATDTPVTRSLQRKHVGEKISAVGTSDPRTDVPGLDRCFTTLRTRDLLPLYL